jgi:hypothetical protein
LVLGPVARVRVVQSLGVRRARGMASTTTSSGRGDLLERARSGRAPAGGVFYFISINGFFVDIQIIYFLFISKEI